MNSFGELVNSSNPEYSMMMERANSFASKWEPSGLLEGLSGTDRVNMGVLLENQAIQVLRESTNATNMGGASFSTGNGEQWAGISLPMVRRIFHETISAKEFVSVQPLQVPAGLVFYLDFKYNNTKAPFVSGQSVYGATSTYNTDPTGGLYGAGRYGYSLNTSKVTVAATVTNATMADVNFYDPLSASVTANEIKKVRVPVASLTNYDVNAVRSFVISGSGATEDKVLQAFTERDDTYIYFYVTGSSVTSGNVDVTYSLMGKDNYRGDFEDRTGNLTIPEFKVDFRSEMIGTHTRKLKAEWTTEFMQDVKAYQNIDAEAELTSLLSDYVAMEIDLEILDMLIQNANTQDWWSAENNTVINSTGTSFAPLTSGYYNSQGQWFQTLGTKLNKVSNKIHQKTLRGPANFMVVSPTVSTILESIPGFAANGDGTYKEYAMGVQKVGQFDGRFKVYKNPYFTENVILMGYKGSQYLETGAVYAPYIPLMMSPTIPDPNTFFTHRKGLMTRYGKKMLRPEFYATIVVQGLNTI